MAHDTRPENTSVNSIPPCWTGDGREEQEISINQQKVEKWVSEMRIPSMSSRPSFLNGISFIPVTSASERYRQVGSDTRHMNIQNLIRLRI